MSSPIATAPKQNASCQPNRRGRASRFRRSTLSGERVERRLAAILAADVAGYSRLMGLDEEGTLAALKGHRRAVVDPKIAEHRGRIVKTTGDGMLVEFASIVDALRCAVDVQRQMAERNVQVPSERRIEFRIGLNVGDIIIDDKDIYGDGVNIAARLEALAEPGGICVSRIVRDEVRAKLNFSFEDMGANIRSRTSPGRCVSIAFGSIRRPMRRSRQRSPRPACQRRGDLGTRAHRNAQRCRWSSAAAAPKRNVGAASGRPARLCQWN
jgi:class 3 adenylate cyclase